jgi:hypothetical protein
MESSSIAPFNAVGEESDFLPSTILSPLIIALGHPSGSPDLPDVTETMKENHAAHVPQSHLLELIMNLGDVIDLTAFREKLQNAAIESGFKLSSPTGVKEGKYYLTCHRSGKPRESKSNAVRGKPSLKIGEKFECLN